ncbi:hypothetical protein DUNSADRAFT_12212 [Dunaliella salina]|uniref:Uncharacterized protein n=1 Tax=Dunaliella salina TaxID=3046 RepID=A0ABQ7GBP3_DUNSA|nr:hypothetical protein DUNSADRAFT_12212 [Dunaliella salina]|eukprot:KAF5832032.1 hypothetical protein DUNSADRAFT_12212 [Dunaliella salina]
MRHAVLSKYRQLLKLIHRLPHNQFGSALQDARERMRAGRLEQNPERQLNGLKELAARIGYLRIVTPRMPGDVAAEAGTFVLNREGELVESQGGSGASNRAAKGVLSMDEAMRLNRDHFKRFYGADKPAPGKTFF